ncbi:uncharacterized protein LOC127263921 [Andrographis paniculata]|uniref:uncharacterized protein LOC127263921 n=1 Tax=Andrographis paniculata TaxID=175694 RepID=UPI0021E6F829|nr:uncharacterized protein LOC127263921 [Andrographis paniculata]
MYVCIYIYIYTYMHIDLIDIHKFLKMDYEITNLKKNHKIKLIPDEEEDDESISLRDFQVDSDRKDSISKNNRRSSSEPADFFEFLNDFTSEMSHAEDIFYCGKLVPHNATHRRRFLKSLSEHNLPPGASARYAICDDNNNNSFQSKSDAVATTPPRNRFLERRNPRSSSKSSAKSEASRDSKPKWFELMFSPLKFQQELDFRGVKNRRNLRNPGSIFSGDRTPPNRRSFWSHDLLKVLSCKNHASVAVTASIGLVPHF